MTTRVIIKDSEEVAVCEYGDDADVIFENYKKANRFCVKTVFDGIFDYTVEKEFHVTGCSCTMKEGQK